jgi:hypothetical protein
MRKTILTGIVIICVIILMLCGCIAFSDSDEKNQYLYEIRITMDHPFNYTVYAPFIADNGQAKLMENMKSNLRIKHGNGKFEINWTEHGPALKIEASDSIYIASEYEDGGEYRRLSLSMYNENNETADDNLEENWIYCEGIESGNLEISIELTSEAGECCGERNKERTSPEYQMISTTGWQIINTENSLRL